MPGTQFICDIDIKTPGAQANTRTPVSQALRDVVIRTPVTQALRGVVIKTPVIQASHGV